jgi:hypothetical protein
LATSPEFWLRGPVEGISPLLTPVAHAYCSPVRTCMKPRSHCRRQSCGSGRAGPRRWGSIFDILAEAWIDSSPMHVGSLSGMNSSPRYVERGTLALPRPRPKSCLSSSTWPLKTLWAVCKRCWSKTSSRLVRWAEPTSQQCFGVALPRSRACPTPHRPSDHDKQDHPRLGTRAGNRMRT